MNKRKTKKAAAKSAVKATASAMKAGPGMRTCTDCLLIVPLAGIEPGKRICRDCHSKRVMASQQKQKNNSPELVFDTCEPGMRFGPEAFQDRDSLSDMLKGNLGQSVNEANEMVELQKARLRAAVELANPKLIGEASKDLQAAMEHRAMLTTRLMEKLQAMEDLRAKQEKAKDVVFFFNKYPKRPNIVATRSMPESAG